MNKRACFKRVMCIGLSCAMLGVTAVSAAELVLGDLDSNGIVSLRDVLLALKDVKDVEKLPEDKVALADVDLDQSVTEADAKLIFRKATGDIIYYPGEVIKASGKVYIAGDSIAAEHGMEEGYDIIPSCGWGQVFQNYFDSEKVNVQNKARSGRSSGSYIKDTDYSDYIGDLAKGDYYLISFGHNDEKEDRYSDPYGSSDTRGSFKWNLKTYYIEPALKVGAYPILVSSVVRCRFTNNQLNAQSHTPYAIAMEELVEEYKAKGYDVGYIDLHQITMDYYNEIGQEAAEAFHSLHIDGLDQTHYNEAGANMAAQFIINEMVRQGYDLSQYLLNAE